MPVFFNVIGSLCLLASLFACVGAKAAPAEIEGLLLFLIGAVFMTGAALISAVRAITAAQAAVAPAKAVAGVQPVAGTHVKCPSCREFVIKTADTCPHCFEKIPVYG